MHEREEEEEEEGIGVDWLERRDAVLVKVEQEKDEQERRWRG